MISCALAGDDPWQDAQRAQTVGRIAWCSQRAIYFDIEERIINALLSYIACNAE